jgi:Protein of unknown function (DUF1501)
MLRLAPPAWDGLLHRRDLLRIGAIGVAGAILPTTSAGHRPAAATATADSVIFLWMAGGMTHIDSFDPKPDTPAEIRGNLRAIRTCLPGVHFGDVMPRMAAALRHATVLRSFSHDSNDHFLSQAYMLSGRKVPMSQIQTEPNIGAIVAKVNGPRGGLPGYIAVPGTTRPGPPPTNLFTGGWLGGQYAPFSTGGRPRNEDFTARVAEASEDEFNQQALNLPLGMTGHRLGVRRSLRERLDAGLRQVEAQQGEDALAAQYHSAFGMLTNPAVRSAFDLNRETAPMRDRYGRTKIGQRCLLARRLVEAGARFVMVDYGYDPEYGNLWDNHNAPVQNHPPIMEIIKRPWHLAGVDMALAALLEDLHARGMLQRTLVVLLTEFGRTPQINREGGRDHWGAAGSLVFAGGGVRGGQVIGATDKHAAQPTTSSWTPGDVAATIYQALGIDQEGTLYDRQHRPHPVLPAGRVIPGVF